jgi:DNA-binding transcriptional regulator YiaG
MALPPDYADSRQVKLEMAEPKRRLIRDARVLYRLRNITQDQMADELGISKRTLEEWLQYRRMPQAPSEALLRRWVENHRQQIS